MPEQYYVKFCGILLSELWGILLEQVKVIYLLVLHTGWVLSFFDSVIKNLHKYQSSLFYIKKIGNNKLGVVCASF